MKGDETLARVAVVGSSGAGKTTLARELAGALGSPHVELDTLHWGPGWTPAPGPVFRDRLGRALSGDRWVVDGNYSVVRDLVWTRATAIVWLDYRFPVVFQRAVARTVRRIVTREELWSGNRESLRHALEPDWIPWWVIRTYRRRRREYPALLRRPEFAHLEIRRFRRPRDARQLVEQLAREGPRD